MNGTLKESFSGPAPTLSAAHRAATAKFGPRNGAWSRWVVEAVLEKLKAENPDLYSTLDTVSTATTDHRELIAKITAAVEVNPDLRAEIERLLHSAKRSRRTRPAAAA